MDLHFTIAQDGQEELNDMFVNYRTGYAAKLVNTFEYYELLYVHKA